jgi:hypothetical protein
MSAACLSDETAGKIADAIYKVEGGAKAKVPYGILSVKVKDENDARRICLNTIRNNWKRWEKAGSEGKYLDFLANRYCPESADPVGNSRWKKNIRKISGLDL